MGTQGEVGYSLNQIKQSTTKRNNHSLDIAITPHTPSRPFFLHFPTSLDTGQSSMSYINWIGHDICMMRNQQSNTKNSITPTTPSATHRPRTQPQQPRTQPSQNHLCQNSSCPEGVNQLLIHYGKKIAIQ